MSQRRGLPLATDIWVKRRPPVDRDHDDRATSWVLLVAYRAEGNEHAARLPLSSDAVAARVERLLRGARLGQRRAAQELFACLHQEWGRGPLVGRHPAWEAIFRFLAPLAAPAPVGDLSET